MEKISKKSIPNILTIVRIILAVFAILFVCIYKYWDYWDTEAFWYTFNDGTRVEVPITYILAGVFFVIASFTDLMDGQLARKYHWISDFGKLWDPIADKILINGVLIGLAVNGSIPVFIPIIMICRDIIVDASRMYASTKGKVVAANIWGKLKTVFQMIAIILILFSFGIVSNNLVFQYLVQNLLLLVATVFSVVSGVIYEVQIFKKEKHANEQQKAS